MGGRGGQGDGRGKWLALTAALLGWMFDGLEMGLFPLVARPAIGDLLQQTDDREVGRWFAVATAAFLVGAATGGVLFGWLGDRVGRVRAMTLSVLTYSVFSGLCAFAQSPEQISILRFVSALGMGGEWALGVALVMEIWPDSSRAFLAGLIGAAANVGYLLMGLVGAWVATNLEAIGKGLLGLGLPADWVEPLVRHSGWRLLMLLGAVPALLTFFIRLFVPESERWEQEQRRGTTSNWAARDLAGVGVGALGALALIYLWATDLSLLVQVPLSLLALAVVAVGYTYPVLRYLQRSAAAEVLQTVPAPALSAATGAVPAGEAPPSRDWTGEGAREPAGGGDAARAPELGPTLRRMFLGASLGGVALLGTWASIQWASVWADKLVGGRIPEAKADTQFWSAAGAIIGTILGALLGGWAGRRIAYTVLCVGSLASSLFFFRPWMDAEYGPLFLAGAFLAGGFTASFYGWLPLYLPELFPTRVRATGQGFSFNFGRILAAVGALQTGNLIRVLGGDDARSGGYPVACSIMSLIYLVGIAIIWLAPETRGKPLPE